MNLIKFLVGASALSFLVGCSADNQQMDAKQVNSQPNAAVEQINAPPDAKKAFGGAVAPPPLNPTAPASGQ